MLNIKNYQINAPNSLFCTNSPFDLVVAVRNLTGIYTAVKIPS